MTDIFDRVFGRGIRPHHTSEASYLGVIGATLRQVERSIEHIDQDDTASARLRLFGIVALLDGFLERTDDTDTEVAR